MDDGSTRALARQLKVNPAGKTLADIKREIKKIMATSQGKSTPADPKAAQKAQASKPQAAKTAAAPAQAAAPKAKTAAKAADQAPNLQALLAECQVAHTMMAQTLAVLKAAIDGTPALVATTEVEQAVAPEEGNIEVEAQEEAPASEEAAQEEAGALTHEFIDSA